MRTFPALTVRPNPGLGTRRLLIVTGIPVASLIVLQIEGMRSGHAHADVMLPGALGLFLLAVCRVALLAREVSDASTDIRISQERYELMSRATNDAIWDLDLTSGSVIFSDAIHTKFGHPLDQRDSLLDWWESLIHPDDAGRVGHRRSAPLPLLPVAGRGPREPDDSVRAGDVPGSAQRPHFASPRLRGRPRVLRRGEPVEYYPAVDPSSWSLRPRPWRLSARRA